MHYEIASPVLAEGAKFGTCTVRDLRGGPIPRRGTPPAQRPLIQEHPLDLEWSDLDCEAARLLLGSSRLMWASGAAGVVALEEDRLNGHTHVLHHQCKQVDGDNWYRGIANKVMERYQALLTRSWREGLIEAEEGARVPMERGR